MCAASTYCRANLFDSLAASAAALALAAGFPAGIHCQYMQRMTDKPSISGRDTGASAERPVKPMPLSAGGHFLSMSWHSQPSGTPDICVTSEHVMAFVFLAKSLHSCSVTCGDFGPTTLWASSSLWSCKVALAMGSKGTAWMGDSVGGSVTMLSWSFGASPSAAAAAMASLGSLYS